MYILDLKCNVHRTVQELGIQAFMEQSSRKLTELFRIKCATLRKNC